MVYYRNSVISDEDEWTPFYDALLREGGDLMKIHESESKENSKHCKILSAYY